jgi:hypothetical protein
MEADGTVESAPDIEAASFNGGATINGSTSKPFTARQAGVITRSCGCTT